MKAAKNVRIATAAACCASGFFLAVLATASPAGADPVDPAPPPPAPLVVLPAPGPPPGPDAIVQAAAPAPPAAPDAPVLPPDAPVPPPDAAAVSATPPNGIPHLASPDALPPGSTMVPQDMDSPNVSYLKDLWQAVQNHEISGKEALIMGMAQRGMNTPIPGQAPGPNVPLTPGDPALAPPPPPAPVPPAPAPPIP
ncbi:hypothetical protein H7J06_18850 [Mycobacterium hodleri]|uniref:hypothetical protein n=1 Tax=Mycolicibacterium hodleri TaxID=49897 RepID=UPI0021F39005|nr:hypothetical protein [Mycolicibacterium hodleri]MCV7135042.1 hypothetical protein [Mycolicibacterium hodleri]